MQSNYVYLFGGATSGSGLIPLFSSSEGGETAGSVADNSGNSSFSSTSYSGGETAGSVACSSGSSGSSCGGGSFSTIA